MFLLILVRLSGCVISFYMNFFGDGEQWDYFLLLLFSFNTTNMSELLESTGYSWSGVHDIVSNAPENTEELLMTIDAEYNSAKLQQIELEKQLKRIKSKRSRMVSMFCHLHSVLKLPAQEPLCFERDGFVITVDVNTPDTEIGYDRFKKTSLTPPVPK